LWKEDGRKGGRKRRELKTRRKRKQKGCGKLVILELLEKLKS